MDLESRNAALIAELASPTRATASSSSNTPFIPRAPARHTLTSHRSTITRVAFHPTWTVLASASEDASVKIWDWEGGEFERTVKGHTKAVMDVDFDPKGTLMGESLLPALFVLDVKGVKRLGSESLGVWPRYSLLRNSRLRIYPNYSYMLLGLDDKALGSCERIHQHKDATRPRSFRLDSTIYSGRRKTCQCESGQDDTCLGSFKRVLREDVLRPFGMG